MSDQVPCITQDLEREDTVKTVSNKNSEMTFRKIQKLQNV